MLPVTEDGGPDSHHDGSVPTPGVIVVFSGRRAVFAPIPLPPGGAPLVVGRAGEVGSQVCDDRLSRQHAEIAFVRGSFVVRDLDSRNGTYVNGDRVLGEVRPSALRVVRVADTLIVPCADVSGVIAPTVAADGTIAGSRLGEVLRLVERSAASSEALVVLGESGTGKELASRTFHAHGPNARGPFVAINCAAIPSGLAERLLFGVKRGTYSGAAADATGHVEAADGGVLFLDEVAELDSQVQAKLLRVLETREVVPLGASHGRRVSVRVVVATHRDLRAAVATGAFRADLYHRLAPPEITLPPLRDRLDEIACHVTAEIARDRHGLTAQAKLVEACLLRHWPGNVRELRKQIRHATVVAAAAGQTEVRVTHLPRLAGEPLVSPPPPPSDPASPSSAGTTGATAPLRRYKPWTKTMTREVLERALAEHSGNVSLTARSLRMPRSQIYVQMERLGLRKTPPRPESEH